jgi:hypothetical protein
MGYMRTPEHSTQAPIIIGKWEHWPELAAQIDVVTNKEREGLFIANPNVLVFGLEHGAFARMTAIDMRRSCDVFCKKYPEI